MSGSIERQKRNSNLFFAVIGLVVCGVLLVPGACSKLRPKPRLPAILAETAANCPAAGRETVYRSIGKASIAILCADPQQQKAASLSPMLAGDKDEGFMCYRSGGGGHVRPCQSASGVTEQDDWLLNVTYQRQPISAIDANHIADHRQVDVAMQAPLRLSDGFYCSDQRYAAETMCFSRLASPSLNWSASVTLPGRDLDPELLQRQLQRAMRYLAAHVTDPA